MVGTVKILTGKDEVQHCRCSVGLQHFFPPSPPLTRFFLSPLPARGRRARVEQHPIPPRPSLDSTLRRLPHAVEQRMGHSLP